MPFRCPVCKTPTLQPDTLDPDLPTDRCTTCGGHWITSARYFAYAAHAPGDAPHVASDPPADPPVPKFCPACTKFMRYYPVGHGVPFGIDKCGTCGGVWLNDGEWQALAARGFHRRLHAISSDAWQAEVSAEHRAQTDRHRVVRHLGETDVAELDRLIHWLDAHPHRTLAIAYLQRHLHTHRPAPRNPAT
jgi:Zn-finger nucleic acid-binding protein